MIKQAYEQKLSIGEILSNAWDIYSNNFKPILIITLLIYVPINIILFFSSGILSGPRGLKLYFDIIKLLEGLFGIIATMGIAVIVEKAIFTEVDSQISWGESLGRAVSRWGSCIVTDILGGLIIFGLILLLIVPGIIWSLYYSFIIQVVILKNLSGKKALDYSKSLVKGQWWLVFVTLLVIYSINIIISMIIGLVSGFLPELAGIVTDSIIDIISAYFTVATTIYFINLDNLKGSGVMSEEQSVETYN